MNLNDFPHEKDGQEKFIKKKILELKQYCLIAKIPFFVSVEFENDTRYNEGLTTATLHLDYPDTKIFDCIKLMNGYTVINEKNVEEIEY